MSGRSKLVAALIATLFLFANVGTPMVGSAKEGSSHRARQRLSDLEDRVVALRSNVAALEQVVSSVSGSQQARIRHPRRPQRSETQRLTVDERVRRVRRQLTRLDPRVAALEMATTDASSDAGQHDLSVSDHARLRGRHGPRLGHLSRWTTDLEARVEAIAQDIPLPDHVGPLPVSCPVGAEAISPTDDLAAVVQAAGPGASLCLKPGIYRPSGQIRPLSGQTLTFESGAVLSGARVTTGWTKQGAYWVLDKQTQDFSSAAWLRGLLCNEDPPTCLYEDLFRDGTPLQQSTSLQALTEGQVYFDKSSDRMYIVDDPTGHTLEASVLTTGISSSASGVTIRGAVIEKMGLIGMQADGPGWTIEDCEIRNVHVTGLRLVGDDHTVRRNFVHHIGNTGIVATSGSRLLFESNEVAFNNYLHFGQKPVPYHEGGAKFLLTSNVVLRGNYSHDNEGDGWWFDTDNINITVENNLFEANTRYGFFYEVSYDAVIRNNIFRENATDPTWMGSGLRIASSKNVEVSGNNFENNRYSTLSVNSADRGSGTYGVHETTGLYVHDNVFTIDNGWIGTPYGLDAITSTSANNQFAGNDYIVPDISTAWWIWGPGKRIGWASWKAFGFDVDGSLSVG